MPRQRYVASAEEIAARRKRREAGLPVTEERDAVALRNRIVELETELNRRVTAVQDRGPTSRELRKNFDKLLEHYDVEPAEEIIKIILSKKVDEDGEESFVLPALERARLWEGLQQYRMPKLKAVEMSGTVEHNLTIKVVQFSVETGQEVLVKQRTIDLKKEHDGDTAPPQLPAA